MLTFDETTFGIQECQLSLSDLYSDRHQRQDFLDRLDIHLKSDSHHQQLFSLHGDTLRYCSEVFVPDKIDDRPALLLLLGNPASHSVAAGMCFAYEGADGRTGYDRETALHILENWQIKAYSVGSIRAFRRCS